MDLKKLQIRNKNLVCLKRTTNSWRVNKLLLLLTPSS